jgi:HEAT repeat protein
MVIVTLLLSGSFLANDMIETAKVPKENRFFKPKSSQNDIIQKTIQTNSDTSFSEQTRAIREILLSKADIQPVIIILEHALQSDDQRKNLMGLAGLAQIGSKAKRALPTINRFIQSTDGVIRLNAIVAIGLIGISDPTSIPSLCKGLSDSELDVRCAAATALGKMGKFAKPAIPALSQTLPDTDPYYRVCVATAIWSIEGDISTSFPVLYNALLVNDVGTRLLALSALAEMGFSAQEAIPAIIPLLQDKYAVVRARAARTLGYIGQGPKTIIILNAMLDDSDAEVRRFVKDTISMIREREQKK